MILKICVLVLFSVAVIKSEDQDLDSLLDGIFTSPSTPVDGNTGVISGVLDGGLNVDTGLGQDGNGIGGQDGEPAKVSILRIRSNTSISPISLQLVVSRRRMCAILFVCK